MFSVVAIYLAGFVVKHDYDYNYDYTSARLSSSLANSLTGCYNIKPYLVKHWDIKNSDINLNFVN